jgi:16S rRNA (guanine527-N7)-methyltransferase
MMQSNGMPNLPLDVPLELPPDLPENLPKNLPENLPASLPVDLPTTDLPTTLSAELPLLLELWQSTCGWQPDPAQHQQFQHLYAQILDGNQRLNLTRITEPTEFWEKHLWDSLSGLMPFLGTANRQREAESGAESGISAIAPPVTLGQLPRPFSVIDIGTGAGFPGIPVAIAFPDATVTLLDSTRKKIVFIDSMLATLGLSNTKTCVERVEQIGQQRQHRGAYDVALLRAVAPATVCAEYALPLLSANGLAILYRGQWTADEETALKGAIAQLGGRLEHVAQFTTPLSQSQRHCLYLRKVAPTPGQFPRAVGVPSQLPL